MVKIKQAQRQSPAVRRVRQCGYAAITLFSLYGMTSLLRNNSNSKDKASSSLRSVASPTAAINDYTLEEQKQESEQLASCPYMSLSDLSYEERYPSAGSRHMISPPKGGTVTLVCCETTKGPWNIAVHSVWAPLGAERFLEMVNAGYFTKAEVPLFRCIKNWLCQFGLSSNPDLTKQYNTGLQDDPQWLPLGPKFRQQNGVKRFAQGYMAYAGSGPNSRSNQFIVAIQPNGPLAGGSPWEVPWGELVGSHSYETLAQIYTGYGENGPSQGVLHRKGVTDEVAAEFVDLDYITSCRVVDQEKQDTK